MNLAYLPTLLIGTKITVLISVSAMVFGLLLALIGAACELSSTPFKTIAYVLHAFIRGLPDILIIFACNFGAKILINSIWPGHCISPFIAGVIALSMIVAAYASQIIVASYHAIPKGMIDAALTLHLSKKDIAIKIIMPQLIKHALPALINLWLVILKDSSIVGSVKTQPFVSAKF